MDTLHHVAIAVSDIAQAAQWFRQRFDCSVAYQDDTWALLEFANASLALVLPSQHRPHVCFLRDDAEKFGPLTEHRDGTRTIYLDGPDGNVVEVLDPKSLGAIRR